MRTPSFWSLGDKPVIYLLARRDYSAIRVIQDYRENDRSERIRGLWTVDGIFTYAHSVSWNVSKACIPIGPLTGVQPISIVGLAQNAVEEKYWQHQDSTRRLHLMGVIDPLNAHGT